MPKFLALVFVKIGVSRVDGSKIWVCNEIDGIEKVTWEVTRLEKRNTFS